MMRYYFFEYYRRWNWSKNHFLHTGIGYSTDEIGKEMSQPQFYKRCEQDQAIVRPVKSNMR